MKYILLSLLSLLYLFEFTKAFSVTFPTLKKNYAIVKNIKVNKLSDNDKNKLIKLFDNVPVIVFKDQKINPQEYFNFLKIFDDNYNNISAYPPNNTITIPYQNQIALINQNYNKYYDNKYNITTSELREVLDNQIKYNYLWHQDLGGHIKHLPNIISAIYNLITPSDFCDDTIFVSYEDAYDLIEPKLKKKLLSYNTINSNSINRFIESNCDYTGLRIDKKINYDDDIFNKQPLVIYSDKKKYRKSLLLNPNRFLKFDKLNYEDSNDLYRHIMHKYVLKEKNYIIHKWENNDLCIFNNRKLVHSTSPVGEYVNNDRIFLQCFLVTNEPIIPVNNNKSIIKLLEKEKEKFIEYINNMEVYGVNEYFIKMKLVNFIKKYI